MEKNNLCLPDRVGEVELAEHRMRSYGNHIAGKEVAGAGWVYTVSARSLLEDVFTAVKLKRTLEQEAEPAAWAHPLRGRPVRGGTADQMDESIAAAAAAGPVWAAVPLAERMRLGELFRQASSTAPRSF